MEISRLDVERELRSRFALYKPYPKQIEFHNSMASCRLISGANQQVVDSTMILTIEGYKRADEIVVGDILYDVNGKKTKVLEIHPHSCGDTYRIEFDDGTWIKCDSEHNWLMKRYSTSPLKRMKTKDMLIGSRVPLVKYDNDIVADGDKEDYLLGHYIGNGWCKPNKDGTAGDAIRISCDLECYNLLSGIYSCSNFNDKIKTFLVHDTAELSRWLRSIGCHGSHNKFIPEGHWTKEMFMGLMDSDGSCDWQGRVSYSSCSERLIKEVCELGRRLGCKWRISKKITRLRGKEYIGYCVRGRCPFNPFRLRSRAEKWKPNTVGQNERIVRKIEQVALEPSRCFFVDSETHTFLCQDCIVTGNSGKTIAGTHEVAFQATGIFPEWYKGWKGKSRIDVVSGKPVFNVVVAATDSKTLRDSIMKKIVGSEQDDFSDGLIAKKYQVPGSIVKARSVTGLLDSIQIYREDGGICTIYFRSYEQGRENLQSLTADYVYCDEEPPQDVYAELMARLNATGGHFAMAFTPLKGLTLLVQEYWNHDNPDKFLTCMNIYEVDHIAKYPDKIARIKSSFSGLSESEREARMMGIPAMGSGTVYPVSDESIRCDAFEIPRSWPRIAGLDFGRGEHPIACAWIAFDPQGCAYVYDCFKLTRVGDAEVAAQILARGSWIPVAYPHDFMRSSGISTINDETKTEGWIYKEIFAKYGINFTDHNAKTEEGSVRVEAGIVRIRQAMVEGKFKVFSHLTDWFKEKATYLYKEDGTVTKANDDILDATRYAFVMSRYAVPENLGDNYDLYLNPDKATDNTVEND